jgi:hypothetical protein
VQEGGRKGGRGKTEIGCTLEAVLLRSCII